METSSPPTSTAITNAQTFITPAPGQKPFYGNIPTTTYINIIRKKYPDKSLKANQIIPYSEIKALLHCDYRSNRWQLITRRWRKIVEDETGKIIGTKSGKAFIVLTERDKIGLSMSKLHSAARYAARSLVIANRINTRHLDNEDLARIAHQTDISSKIIAASQLKSKQLLPTI